MVDEKDILGKLVVEEKDVTKGMEQLVEEASKFFKIEKPSGRIIFQNFGSLTDQQRICVILLGKYFANKLGLVTDPSLSISELAKEIGKPMTTLSFPIKELAKKGFVEKLPVRKYRIAYHRIKEIIDGVLVGKKKK